MRAFTIEKVAFMSTAVCDIAVVIYYVDDSAVKVFHEVEMTFYTVGFGMLSYVADRSLAQCYVYLAPARSWYDFGYRLKYQASRGLIALHGIDQCPLNPLTLSALCPARSSCFQ